MLRSFCFFKLLFFLFAGQIVQAAEEKIAKGTIKSISVPYGQRLKIESKFLVNEQRVDIYLPNDYELDSNIIDYPVVVTLDGWTLSQAVSGVTGHLMNTAAFPKSIIVALHTEVWPLLPNAYVHNTDNWLPDTIDGYVSLLKKNKHNSAEDFWQFLELELFPLLKHKYRAGNFRSIIGMSPSAILALHTMLQQPDLFDAYILIAATDVFGLGYTYKRDFVEEVLLATKKGKLDKKYLYIASGEMEKERDIKHSENAVRLKSGLAKLNSDLRFEIEHIKSFEHYPVALPAMLSAFDMIFPRSSFQTFKRTLKQGGDVVGNIKRHYMALSKKYGTNLFPQTGLQRNANTLRSLGYHLMQQKNFEQAQKAFEHWVELADKDPEAYYWLARLHAAKKEYALAMKYQRSAIALTGKENSAKAGELERTLRRYRIMLNTKS